MHCANFVSVLRTLHVVIYREAIKKLSLWGVYRPFIKLWDLVIEITQFLRARWTNWTIVNGQRWRADTCCAMCALNFSKHIAYDWFHLVPHSSTRFVSCVDRSTTAVDSCLNHQYTFIDCSIKCRQISIKTNFFSQLIRMWEKAHIYRFVRSNWAWNVPRREKKTREKNKCNTDIPTHTIYKYNIINCLFDCTNA